MYTLKSKLTRYLCPKFVHKLNALIAIIRYANHELEGEEILKHIAAGKRVTRSGLTWNDRISFVLTESMQIKRNEFLDIIKEESTKQAGNVDEMFELDFTLMTGELAKMLADLTNALGGEIVHS